MSARAGAALGAPGGGGHTAPSPAWRRPPPPPPLGRRTMNNPGSGFENSFSTMVASQANRYKFITEVMAFCDKYGFDG